MTTTIRSRLSAAGAIAALALFAAAPAPTRTAAPDVTPYKGLGTWVDLYSPSFRAEARVLAARLAAHHVHTLFIETGNYRQGVDLVSPSQLGAVLDAAHARNIAVVGWYLPSFTNPALDLRRALAAIDFVSPSGARFDSFALDIESSLVRNVARRTRRLLALSTRLRTAVGPNYPLGAIIPSPVGMQLLPHYWPAFPYAGLARTYDVILPMAYFSYRARDPVAVARYAQSSIAVIRNRSGRSGIPIHVIGGLAGSTSRSEAAAFVRAVTACGVTGFSLYDFGETSAAVWPMLENPSFPAATAWSCHR
jgi:hypothetical protein